ncbi:MAG: hypothetical protein HF314_02280 [Ignavibacteria bacterium]|jgi:hypothetical protein|nr:hypothetical protein [Ignavibacteria bacterium]MCU7501873.1 hypothetical protein [Ignavibacteria bacterium]MCU7514781.1 hypothetical protein [Ignavibacteria bacterium]
MKYFNLLLISSIVSFTFFSCGPAVNVTSLKENRPPKPKDYNMIIAEPEDRLIDECVPLGQINVFDAGLAANCSFRDVLVIAIERAKKIGADAIKLIEVKKPDGFSTCYRIKAMAYAYHGPAVDSLTYENLLAPPDASDQSFIAFNDCSSCSDFGNTGMLSKSTKNIILLPFSVTTVYENGKKELVHYPATESGIMGHLKTLLGENNQTVELIDKDTDNFDRYLKYYGQILDDCYSGKATPLGWGESASIELKDTTSVIYIPFAIEREAQHHVNARFYVLVADSRGKVIFSRCIGYNPILWSADINSFINETKGILPLTESKMAGQK